MSAEFGGSVFALRFHPHQQAVSSESAPLGLRNFWVRGLCLLFCGRRAAEVLPAAKSWANSTSCLCNRMTSRGKESSPEVKDLVTEKSISSLETGEPRLTPQLGGSEGLPAAPPRPLLASPSERAPCVGAWSIPTENAASLPSRRPAQPGGSPP